MLYTLLLGLHNLMRWVVLVAAVWLLIRTYMGLFRRADWTAQEGGAVRYYVIAMDTQLILGLILYFVSPITQAVMGNFGAAMGDDQLRFFGVEHFSLMLIAVVLAHVGSVMVKRAADSRRKFVRAAIWFTLSALIVAFAIPWWRPLLPAIS